MTQKALYLLFLTGALLFGISLALFFQCHKCHAQTSYYGPTSPVTGMVPIEVEVYDDPQLNGVTVQDISFDGQKITLKPAGVGGFRGGGSFKKPPGNYDLTWSIARSQKNWPRVIQKKQKIRITQNDVWVQIAIHGEQLTVR